MTNEKVCASLESYKATSEEHLEIFVNNNIMKCNEGYYQKGMDCEKCPDNCIECQTSSSCITCKYEYVLTSQNTCELKSNTNLFVNNVNSTVCIAGYGNKNGECIKCSETFGETCEECDGYGCLKSIDGFITEKGISKSQDETGCEYINTDHNGYCEQCQEKSYVYNGEICEKNKNNCLLVKNKTNCFKCEKGYLFNDVNFTCNRATNEKCVKWSDQQEDYCIRCEDGYFYSAEDNQCKQCPKECETCANMTMCFSCKDGYSLDFSYNCLDSISIVPGCKQLVQGTTQCALCYSYYYRNNEGLCNNCIDKCKTCFDSTKCIQCDDNYFLTSDSSGCLSYDKLLHCTDKKHKGCEKCEDGYFVENQYCSTCSSKTTHCKLCDKYGSCTTCEKNYVLDSHQCVHYQTISGCLSEENSKCSSCTFWYAPSSDGLMCEEAPVWWVILLAVVGGVLILLVIIILMIFIIKKILKMQRFKNELKQFEVFSIKKTNIQFVPTTNSDVQVSRTEIQFLTTDEEDKDSVQIPVDKETIAKLYVANVSKNKIKVQFSMKEGNHKYEISAKPDVAPIESGMAFGFELAIKPLCTCTINDAIKLLSLNLKTKQTTVSDIFVKAETQMSTKIDPDELTDDKKLGEGSFGIVYLGTFRGNKVAIKKMKQSYQDGEDDKRDEMIKEMEMLDKFRYEYIIHFYGAVILPGKECMVTEFAQFGSIQDLLNKRPGQEGITSFIKTKLVYDCSRGINYLHSNGVLHRDIKPDNFLCVSLDPNDKVNAKLTDFGASRNVNMLMTNMTFTKGVGTPTYMAPEILNKEKYKMPADIFSFAVTMYQIFIWDQPYPKTIFKFPWSIADFISSGQRKAKTPEISDDQYDLVQKCWPQDPKERLKIDEIMVELKNMLRKLDSTFEEREKEQEKEQEKQKQSEETSESSDTEEINEENYETKIPNQNETKFLLNKEIDGKVVETIDVTNKSKLNEKKKLLTTNHDDDDAIYAVSLSSEIESEESIKESNSLSQSSQSSQSSVSSESFKSSENSYEGGSTSSSVNFAEAEPINISDSSDD